MPYIAQWRRAELDAGVGHHPQTPGELNYVLTRAVDSYVHRLGLNYTHVNDVLGALEGAKLEFYRRVAAAFEQRKMSENGDVYTETDPSDSEIAAAQFPIGPPCCGHLLSGFSGDANPFACFLPPGHAGTHTYVRTP